MYTEKFQKFSGKKISGKNIWRISRKI